MSDFASALLLELGRATLALTLAAGLALVVLRLAGLQSPRLHRALWLLALLVGWTFGGVSVAIPWQRVEQAREESPAIVASLPPLASDALVELNVHAPPASEATPLEMPLLPVDATPRNFAAPLEFSASPSAEANQAPGERVGLMHRLASLPWPLLVVIAWLAGIGALMAIWLFGYIRFVRAIQVGAHGSERCDEAWQQQWKLLLKQHSVRRPIAMRVTVDTGPLLCRLPRGYELLIPAALWTSLDPAERQSVLQHELAHYLRGDLAKSLVARILALPHWFNPCAWLAVRRFDEAAEWA
jgi:beta-lactamase regulating signal transducer with metallopeptidase domain